MVLYARRRKRGDAPRRRRSGGLLEQVEALEKSSPPSSPEILQRLQLTSLHRILGPVEGLKRTTLADMAQLILDRIQTHIALKIDLKDVHAFNVWGCPRCSVPVVLWLGFLILSPRVLCSQLRLRLSVA